MWYADRRANAKNFQIHECCTRLSDWFNFVGVKFGKEVGASYSPQFSGVLLHFDQRSCVNKVQRRLRLKFLVTGVVGSGSLWRLWSLTMLQVGCRGCLVDVWVLYFPKNNFLPLAFKLSTKSHGICVQWRSIESLDMWKSLLWANWKSLRFCPAISTLFRQGFPLEFANLKYFSFVGLLSRHWVKFRRQEAHNDSSPSIFLYL